MILLRVFLIPSTLRSSNAQKPKPKIYIVRMRRFFFMKCSQWGMLLKVVIFFFADFLVGSKYGKWKISENPRKGFLQSLGWGMNKIKKRIYFLTLHHSSFFCLCHGILLPPVFWPPLCIYFTYDLHGIPNKQKRRSCITGREGRGICKMFIIIK